MPGERTPGVARTEIGARLKFPLELPACKKKQKGIDR